MRNHLWAQPTIIDSDIVDVAGEVHACAEIVPELKAAARRRMHVPVSEQRRWLAAVLREHYAYYGLPSDYRSLNTFFHQVCRIWYRTLRRRSQKIRLTWQRYGQLLMSTPLPAPCIVHKR